MTDTAFRERYDELEARMRALATSDGDVYLPNVAPAGPVCFVFICTEPSWGRWARSVEEAERKVASGFRNFFDSIETPERYAALCFRWDPDHCSQIDLPLIASITRPD